MEINHVQSSKRVETRIRVLAMKNGINEYHALQGFRNWRKNGFGMMECLRRVGLVRASWNAGYKNYC